MYVALVKSSIFVEEVISASAGFYVGHLSWWNLPVATLCSWGRGENQQQTQPT